MLAALVVANNALPLATTVDAPGFPLEGGGEPGDGVLLFLVKARKEDRVRALQRIVCIVEAGRVATSHGAQVTLVPSGNLLQKPNAA